MLLKIDRSLTHSFINPLHLLMQLIVDFQLIQNTFSSLAVFPDGGNQKIAAMHPIISSKRYLIRRLK